MPNHLVIPDVHVQPGISNDRLELAGRLALERRPEIIVCLGDFVDMESLCSYDRGKRSFEGRRYQLDCDASRNALHRFESPFKEYNVRQKRNGKAQYRPRKVMLLGNHENRISRATEDRAELDGTMGIDDLGFREYGWEVVPYLQPIEIDGIFYCHYFVSGVKGEAISGLNVASNILSRTMSSSCAGHIHVFDYAVRTDPSGRQIMALVPGCYFEHKMQYAEHTEHMWWRGLAWLENVHAGAFDLETISLERLKKKYGAN